MRSNLQQAKAKEQFCNVYVAPVCCLWTKGASVQLKSCCFHPDNSPRRHCHTLVERDRNWWSVEGDEHMPLSIKDEQRAGHMPFSIQMSAFLTFANKWWPWLTKWESTERETARLTHGGRWTWHKEAESPSKFLPNSDCYKKRKNNVSQNDSFKGNWNISSSVGTRYPRKATWKQNFFLQKEQKCKHCIDVNI